MARDHTDAKEAVRKAKKERDDLVTRARKAIERVDKFQNELLDEYEQANGVSP